MPTALLLDPIMISVVHTFHRCQRRVVVAAQRTDVGVSFQLTLHPAGQGTPFCSTTTKSQGFQGVSTYGLGKGDGGGRAVCVCWGGVLRATHTPTRATHFT